MGSAVVGYSRFVANTVAVKRMHVVDYAGKGRIQPTTVLNAARGRAGI